MRETAAQLKNKLGIYMLESAPYAANSISQLFEAMRAPVRRDAAGRRRRRFTIYPSDARTVRRGQKVVVPLTQIQKLEMQSKILGDMQSIIDGGMAKDALQKRELAMRKWQRFAEIFDIDLNTFGDASKRRPEDMQEALIWEGELLSAFAAYSFRNSCYRTKSSIRSEAVMTDLYHIKQQLLEKFGRVPGQQADGRMTTQYNQMIAGIKRLQRSPAKPRLPVLQQHLRLVKTVLDLANNKMHRALWALWLTEWQGAMRSGDLIRAKTKDALTRPWNPDLDTHRGRISAQMIFNSRGEELGVGLELQVKPIKNDKNNERVVTKQFLIDEDNHALSAGAAIFNMIKGDEVEGDPKLVPLFRDHTTGKEITYHQSAANFNAALKMVGLHELARGLHSLRIGGTSALCNADGGGESLATTYGGWTSNAVRRYMYVGAGQLAEVTARMARQSRAALRSEEGPISRRQRG